MRLTLWGNFADPVNTRRAPGGVRGEARRPGPAGADGRRGRGATPLPNSGPGLSGASAPARTMPRPDTCAPNAGFAPRRAAESPRRAPCGAQAPGRDRPARLPAALSRRVAPVRQAAVAALVAVAALFALAAAPAQAQTEPEWSTTMTVGDITSGGRGFASSINYNTGFGGSLDAGSNSNTYSPTAADVGKKIRVKVSFTDNAGNSEGPLTSDAYPASGTIAPASITPPPGTDVLVRNTGEALLLGGTSSIGAQSFVTGFNAGGYAVSAVQIRLKSVSGKTTVVRIREDNNGEPGDLVATLTNPASLSSNDINTFTAPSGTTLAASTTYWITNGEGISGSSRLTFAFTAATAETGEPGWSIGDSRLYRTSETLPWFTSTQSSLMIAIKGTAIGAASDDATLGALTVNDGTSDLTLAPAFAPGTFAYAAEVGNAVTTVTLTAMKTDDGASVSAVTLNGTAITDRDFTDGITVSSLLAGDNGIVVTVTAENGDTRTYTLTVTRQAAVDNTAPTASDASVTTNEDTAHTFAEDEFNFADPDAGDALASVKVVTLPMAGGLALDGTAVTLDQAVPAAKIGDLVFTPEANANGTGYASFTFRVSDGTDLSASAYTMTVNVTAVNDPATGAPAISGTAQVGQTLTAATTDIADADGLASPSYGYQWVRVDGSNETDIAGATSGTYTPEAADVGKKLKVKVSFTDDDSNDEELTSDAYPASGTVEAAPNTAPTVTISADKTSAVFKEDDITYTVTRTGSTTAALPVTVRLTQTEDFLAATELTSKTVTIGVGQSTATFTVAASSFQHFAAGTKVGGGTLTATVQDGSAYDPGTTDSVEVDIAIGVMIGFEMAAYSVGEATGPVKVKVIAHTGPGAGQPTSEATYNILPADGSATNGSDFFFVNISASFLVSNFSESGGVWQAEHGYNVTITNDEDDEDDETFDLRIERVQSTATYSLVDASGNSCGSVCTATVTIIDDDTATATPGVTVSKTALTVTEQDTTGDSYTVVLDTEPTANVTVTVAGHSGTDVTPNPATLTFTSTTWSTAQTVTVTAGDDADTDGRFGHADPQRGERGHRLQRHRDRRGGGDGERQRHDHHQHRRHGHADDFRHGAGGRDPDGIDKRDLGRRRVAGQLHLPVGAGGFGRHVDRDGRRFELEHLFADRGGRGQEDQGEGELHRQRGQLRGSAHQRRLPGQRDDRAREHHPAAGHRCAGAQHGGGPAAWRHLQYWSSELRNGFQRRRVRRLRSSDTAEICLGQNHGCQDQGRQQR